MTTLGVFVLLLSPAIGSFLAVLVDRLPRNEDVVQARSTCRDCGVLLRSWDLIPLVSYLHLGGKCRACNTPIPIFVPALEVGALFIAAVVVIYAQSDAQMILGAVWLWCLLALMVCDWRWFRLPDLLTAVLGVAGFGLAFEDPNRTLEGAILAGLAGAAVFWGIRLAYAKLRGREGLGFGDVKLMAGLGAGIGIEALPLTVLIGALGALIFAGVRFVVWRVPANATTALPFGAYLSGSGMVVWAMLYLDLPL